MAYQFPKPPGLSKEQSEKWDRREELDFKIKLWAVCIGCIFLLIMVALIIYSKLK